MSLTKIGSIGINTGIQFAGITTVSTLKVGSGVTLSSDGDVFFTGIATGNGSGLTALNASNISSGTVPTARLGSGTASSSTFLRGDSTFQTVNTDLVSDTSPQLGGNLDVNDKTIDFGDSSGATVNRAKFGAGADLQIWHDGTHNYVYTGNGEIRIKSGSENMILAIPNGAVNLYHNDSKKLETSATGVNITGTTTDDGATHDGDVTFTGANGNILFDKSANALLFGDNVRIKLGAGNDAELYHDGSHTYLKDVGTGNLRLAADDTIVIQKNTGGESIAHFIPDGAVELYYDNSKKLETQSFGINVQGVNSYDAQIKIHNQPTIGRSYWGYGNNQSYTGTLVGRTDSSVASTIFMGVDATGNAGGNFGGLGSEIVFRRDHIFTPPNAANNDFVTCMRFGRATSTEGAVAFTNGLMFGTDQADANILNDYEEGTWTPANDNFSTYTSVTWDATYTKIGNIVHCNAVQTGGTTDWSIQQSLTGIPFAVATTGAGSWTNNAPSDGGEVLIWSDERIYFAQSRASVSSAHKLRITFTYQTT